jgi:1-acyl-sn-glycerol-3-phosphate acyltransferase
MLLIRSLFFYIGQIISTLLFAPLGVIAFPLNFKTRYSLITRWTAFNLWWLKICCRVHYKVEGLDNIPEQACIVMCKHQSAFETLALQLIFVPQVWILKRELLKIPIYGWGLASMQPIAIDRGSAIKSFRQIVAQGCQRLKENLWVIIFPEGTRVAPGDKGTYLPGGGMLAVKSGANVIPIAHNAGYLWPRNTLLKKPGTITLIIGPVIESSNKTAKQITAEVEVWIETTVNNLPKPETS